ncbi:MAG: DUF3842 family protein [Deltaproteobacteria bacterium]|nr:DUF3842 family protein [Deltaproteobacteria bacterium]
MVMDGQGGGIGRVIIKKLRDANSVATSQMMKAGANRGATGENAIINMAPEVDVIIGPLAIIMANSMMGEVTPGMSQAVSTSTALKILIPLTQERAKIVGVSGEPLPHLIDKVIEIIKEGKINV